MDLAVYVGEQDHAVAQMEDFRRFGFGRTPPSPA